MNTRLLARHFVGAAAVAMVASGCGSSGHGSPEAAPSGGDRIHVVASFYPLQFVAARVGGDAVEVANLTPPGVEPHDLELSAKDTADLGSADLIVYLAGFSTAVDDAIDVAAADAAAFDVSGAARLSLSYSPIEEGEQHADERGADPHFWLDPTRLADVADAVAARLSDLDPQQAASFDSNAAALRTELEGLDAEFEAGLRTCANRDIVTGHNAFGYLAARYGFEQVGISGLTPDEEPSPQDLASVTRFVEDHDVNTIYYETLVSPEIAETVAAETGAGTAVLDPIEGLSSDSAGDDYFAVMRADLATLRAGQGCS